MSKVDALIVSTSHWAGDPRLNRHLDYLAAVGRTGTLTTFSSEPRLVALWKSLKEIATTRAGHVLMPDPDLFFLGSLVARITGKKPVIDIHEDYGKAAMAREWVADWARPLVRALADLAVALGRLAAWRVLVAAPELAQKGDHVALNIPDPARLRPSPYDGSKRIVYVGDVTKARGALAMVEMLSGLDESFCLVMVGRVSPETADEISATAAQRGVEARIELTGQIEHDRAWAAARGSLVGLNLLADVPAYREAVATKLWEYMSIGLPPVVSDLPGQRRLLSRLDSALIAASPGEAAQIVKDLDSDPVRRSTLASACRRLVEDAWAENRPDLAVQGVFEP
jgi:glycosyltransferase involved in cell wall biosynthesis